LIQNVVQLIRDKTNGELSLWDKIKDLVKAEVVRGVTTYHRDSLYVKLKSLKSKFFTISEHAIQYESNKFLDEVIELHREMYNSRHDFYPTSFERSITYDESIIACMTKFITMFMALNKEIEN
jgi:hypothetical protein